MTATGLNNDEESSPLLSTEARDGDKGEEESVQKAAEGLMVEGGPVQYPPENGSPPALTPVSRQPWSTGLCCCINFRDEWTSTDAEVCALGCFAPCVLYANNKKRLAPEEDQFLRNCCLYFGLLVASQLLLKGTIIAPCLAFPSRTRVREKYGLQGGGEICGRCMGCMPWQSESHRWRQEFVCDCMVHLFCHTCALCQEGRELRRRTRYPTAQSETMVPPAIQVKPDKATV